MTVPETLFSELLPSVDSLAELKVTLHVLWRTGASGRSPAWLLVGDLRQDHVLLEGLRGEAGGAEAAVEAGLAAAVARGSLVRANVAYRDGARDVVAPNLARGRRALAALHARAAEESAPPASPAAGAATDRPSIFALYEANVGLVQPLIADELRQAAELYPAGWIEDAFAQAVAYNRRNWRYVRRILERWATEGRGKDAAARGRVAASEGAPPKQWVETYRPRRRLPEV